jgi:hypothetical protein
VRKWGVGPAPEEPDYPSLLRHFQSINASNLSSTINILLTLSTGVAAFGVNIIMSAKAPLGAWDAGILVAGLFSLFLSISSGLWLLFNRIADYRITIEGVVLMRDNPGVITDSKLISDVEALKAKADRINKLTTILLRCQAVLFITGFLLLTATVLLTHLATLRT